MPRLLYIRLREKPSFEFGVPMEYSSFSEIFDVDNFSDGQIVSYALEFISSADEVKVVIDAEPKASFGKLLHLFNSLKGRKNIALEIQGEHRMLGFLKV